MRSPVPRCTSSSGDCSTTDRITITRLGPGSSARDRGRSTGTDPPGCKPTRAPPPRSRTPSLVARTADHPAIHPGIASSRARDGTAIRRWFRSVDTDLPTSTMVVTWNVGLSRVAASRTSLLVPRRNGVSMRISSMVRRQGAGLAVGLGAVMALLAVRVAPRPWSPVCSRPSLVGRVSLEGRPAAFDQDAPCPAGGSRPQIDAESSEMGRYDHRVARRRIGDFGEMEHRNLLR